MATVAHWFPGFETQMGAKQINLSSDTLTVGLVASGTFTWGSVPEAYTNVAQFLGGDGSHGSLTEASGGNYSRQPLTGVSFSASGEVVTLTANSPSWPSATFSVVYGWLYDSTVGSGDSTHPIILYWDFGAPQPVTGTTFTLNVPVSGLLSWTGS